MNELDSEVIFIRKELKKESNINDGGVPRDANCSLCDNAAKLNSLPRENDSAASRPFELFTNNFS